jgi:hypothetical protein
VVVKITPAVGEKEMCTEMFVFGKMGSLLPGNREGELRSKGDQRERGTAGNGVRSNKHTMRRTRPLPVHVNGTGS